MPPVVGGFQPQDSVLPPAGGHEDSSSGFGPSGQSFYNSKAVPRGAARSARGVMNGYRGSSNGFRGVSANTDMHSACRPANNLFTHGSPVPPGGYDGYRAPFSNTASAAYGQNQFSTSRDYSSNAYQRVKLPIPCFSSSNHRLNRVMELSDDEDSFAVSPGGLSADLQARGCPGTKRLVSRKRSAAAIKTLHFRYIQHSGFFECDPPPSLSAATLLYCLLRHQ